MPEGVVTTSQYRVTTADYRVPGRQFDDADDAIRYAADLLANGYTGLHIVIYGTRKAALEREEASPRTGTAA